MTRSTHSAPRPRLSVAMIVRNEQDVLPDSIQSVRSIADEIVVLDTGSTDQTLAVAGRLGAVVGQTVWSNDFAAARNACLRLVTGDWVLWLDAGERLAADSARQLREFVDQQADRQKAYLLLVEVPPADAAASGEQAARLRLMPNRGDLRFEGRVRETLQPSIAAAGLAVGTAPGRIVRHARQHDPARKALKARRDLELAHLEIGEHDEPPLRVLLAMGEAYSDLGLGEQARGLFRKAIDRAVKGSTDMLEAYYGLLTALEGDPLLRDLQLSVCLEALELFPFDAQLLLAMGNYLQGQQRLDLAARAFDTAVKYGQADPATWHLTELAEVAAVCLSLTLQLQGSHELALEVLQEALKRHADSPRLVRYLLDLHAKHGRCEEALALAGRLPLAPGELALLGTAIRGACKAVEKDWTAALGHLQSAYVAGCHDPFLLRWLSVALLSNGQIEAAEPVLSEWHQLEPNSAELRTYLAALRQFGEATPAKQQPAAEQAPGGAGGRQCRVDQRTAVPPIAPPISPAVATPAPAHSRL